jgi:hypothetical protein
LVLMVSIEASEPKCFLMARTNCDCNPKD